jgi:hypothetical protein
VNRLFFILCLILSLAAHTSAQDYENCAQVIGSTGKFARKGGRTFTYTVGEPVVMTLKSQRYALTQGFHQPDLCISVSTDNLDLATWNIEVFPNPTEQFLTIRYDANNGADLECAVFNLLGQTVVHRHALTTPSGTLLDAGSWQPGVYILRFRDPATDRTAPVRIVRL